MKQIFVSSTFKDMHIERDLIQTKLSPDLNEHAYKQRKEGVKFQDLRWGIDTELEDEEDKDKKILEVCLDEIQNNRPYLCVLLGDRYGWIPDNDLIKTTGINYGIYDEDEAIEKSIVNLEIDYGILKNPEYADNTFVYIRNIKGDVSGTIYESNEFEKAKMDALKAEIRQIVPEENIHEYDVEYKNGRLVGVEKFVELAKADISRAIIDKQDSEENLSENAREISYHKSQADEKSVRSNARKSVEDSILKNIAIDNIITVKGSSGNGKSTLMARLSEKISDKYKSIILFSSLTPRTTTSAGIMRIITDYINESLEDNQKNLTNDEFDAAMEVFNVEQENLASPNKFSHDRTNEEKLYETALREYFIKGKEDIVILIDAIDQLDNPRSIEDLLRPINFTNQSKIKFIISYLEEPHTVDDFIFLNDYQNYELTELSYEDRMEVVNASLKYNNKELATEVKQDIIAKEGSKSPLYISLLVQRLVMMNIEDYQNIIAAGDGYHIITGYQKEIIEQMPNDLKAVIIELIIQAATNLDTNREDVYEVINYLALSRRGLRESDLRLIYDMKGKTYNALDFSSLKKYLRAFFLEDKHLRTDFTHKIIRKAILETISEEESATLHNDIANAFMQLPVEDSIKLQEQYYSAYKSKNIDAAVEILEAIGLGVHKISTDDAESAVESITKIHNEKLNRGDDEWMNELFFGLSNMDLEIQKILLTYLVYGAYEDKTLESIEASTYNQELLLDYIHLLHDQNEDDIDITQVYADHLSYLGVKLSDGSKYQNTKSEYYLLEAVRLNETLFDRNDSTSNKENLGNAYSNIARYYLKCGGEFKNKAQIYYQKSLAIFENIAEDAPSLVNLENLAMAYNNIANLYASGSDQDLACAKSYYTKTIDIIDKLLEEYDSISLKRTLAMGYINIASLYFSEDKFEMAEKWYDKAITTIREIEAIEPSLENKETLGRVYNNIADIYASELVEDKDQAEDFYNKAKNIFESIVRHKPIVSAKKNLSITYDNLGNLYADWKVERAYIYYKKAIDIKEELLVNTNVVEDYTDLATAYNNLAFLYMDNRAYLDDALRYYFRAIEILDNIESTEIEKKLGEDLATIYTNMGSIYYLLDDLDNSRKYYFKAIGIHRALIEKFNDDAIIEKLLIVYENIAVNMIDLDFDMATIEEEYMHVIDLIKIMQDPYKKVKKTAITYGNLAILYLLKDNNYELAEDCFKKSAYLTKVVIDYHESVENVERLAVIYWNLSVLYELWEKADEAKKYQEMTDELTRYIDYENNKENINKFIHMHDLSKIR